MKYLNKLKIVVLFLIFTSFFKVTTFVQAATTAVDLGTVANFAVLGGSAINDTNPSIISGNVGLSPAAWVPALTCGEVTGTIYSVDGSGPLPCRVTDPGLLTIAKNDLTTAYNDAAGRGASTIPTALGGTTLLDGIYDSAAGTFEIAVGETLTLDGGGNADSVFIFKMGSTLTTFANSKVVVTNGAQACNVFWQVGSSAVLGTGTSFIGNIMADQSVTDNGGSTIDGRFLARIAAVTLNNTTITKSVCAAATSSTSTTTSSSTETSTEVCVETEITTIPTIIETKRVSPTSISLNWGPYAGLDTFNVRYGPTNGDWLYNVDVTGFSTTINSLPANQPFWFQVAARDNCSIGEYGEPKFIGQTGGSDSRVLGVSFPNTGFGPHKNSIFEDILTFFQRSYQWIFRH